MEINYCLKKGKGKGNLYLPSFVVTLFCRRALMSSRSYVAALLCRRALMSHALFAARFCRDTTFFKVYPIQSLLYLRRCPLKRLSSLHYVIACLVVNLIKLFLL
jgi:hypothetical protein